MNNIRLVPLHEDDREHPDPNEPGEDGEGKPDDTDGMFRFRKDMRLIRTNE